MLVVRGGAPSQLSRPLTLLLLLLLLVLLLVLLLLLLLVAVVVMGANAMFPALFGATNTCGGPFDSSVAGAGSLVAGNCRWNHICTSWSVAIVGSGPLNTPVGSRFGREILGKINISPVFICCRPVRASQPACENIVSSLK